MRQTTPRVLAILFTIALGAQLQAAPMFENLKFGDTKKDVQKKLLKSKRFTHPALTMLGRTGLNGFFTTKKKVSGLQFDIHFDWNGSGPLTLKQVELYSNESSFSSLQSAFKELSSTLTAIYGNPKFNNGLPSTTQLPQAGMVLHGAGWYFDSHAVSLGLGRTDKGYNLILSFTESQPQLIQTP